MEKTVNKENDVIEVRAKFNPRRLNERKLRYYQQDALEFVKETYPILDIEVKQDEPGISLIISNYSEPMEGIWRFQVVIDQSAIFKDMANKFEEKKLNASTESAIVEEVESIEEKPKRKKKSSQ
jgi:hypothetical protein